MDFLTPVLLAMDQQGASLNFAGFLALTEQSLAKLSLEQLRKLTAGPKKHLDDEMRRNFTFAVLRLPQQ